jgi:hypothetical protein
MIRELPSVVLEYSVLASIVSATVVIRLCSFSHYRRFDYYLIAPIVAVFDHVYKPGPPVYKDPSLVSSRHDIAIRNHRKCREFGIPSPRSPLYYGNLHLMAKKDAPPKQRSAYAGACLSKVAWTGLPS